MRDGREGGFTLIELLVTVAIFSVVSVGFYSVMFSTVQGSDRAEEVTRVSEEARAAFNRMVRDAREGQDLTVTQPYRFTVRTDFNANNIIENPNSLGDYERLEYVCENCDPGPGRITLNGETLIEGVTAFGAKPFFDYTSNLLEYDWNDDGKTDCLELDVASSAHDVIAVGDGDGVCDGPEQAFLSSIDIALRVTVEDSSQTFVAQAQMRNRR